MTGVTVATLKNKYLICSTGSCFPADTELFLLHPSLFLADLRQSWRSCRTAAGQQIPLRFLHHAGVQPLLGNTMVHHCNLNLRLFDKLCFFTLQLSFTILSIHSVVWEIQQKSKTINKQRGYINLSAPVLSQALTLWGLIEFSLLSVNKLCSSQLLFRFSFSS